MSTENNSSDVIVQEEQKSKPSVLIKLLRLVGACAAAMFLILAGGIAGIFACEGIVDILFGAMPGYIADHYDVIDTTVSYLSFIGIWAAALIWFAVFRKYRVLYSRIGTGRKGNNISMLLIGLLAGFGMNGICILGAWLHKDISLSFTGLSALPFIIVFFAVFVQSSAEELVTRCYLYERIADIFGKPFVAAVLNALLFAALHLSNDGVTPLSLVNLCLFGLFASLIVYYFDSLWCAFAIHASWNFTQNIIFGLPNSGSMSLYSVFSLDPDSARNSFMYNVGFGVEGTGLCSIVLAAGCAAVVILGRMRKKEDTE